MIPEIITRPAEAHDAWAVTELLIERKYDATPYQDEHNQERIAWWLQNGEVHNQAEIQRSLDEPNEHLFRIAAVGGVAIGYLKASAHMQNARIEGGPFTYAQALMVAKAHESQGVGHRLAYDFCRWAVPLGQDVCVEVTVGNDHARTLYEEHGCEYVASVPATPQSPPLDILVLPFQNLVTLFNET